MVRLITRVIVALLYLWTPVALAQSAFFEAFTQDQGLNDGEVSALAQDGDGFIWVGTDSGLIRYDGVRFQHWSNPGYILDMQTAADGCVFFRTRALLIYRLCQGRARVVTGPDGSPLYASSMALTSADRLLVVREGALWIREASGWRTLAQAWHGSQKARRVFALSGGDEFGVVTAQGAYLITKTGVQRLLSAPRLHAVIRRDAHSLFVVGVSPDNSSDDLWLIERGKVRNLKRPEGRFLSWVMRNGTLWLSSDTYLLAVDTENQVRVMQQSEGIDSGGPLLVDRENSLWLGTFTRLLRFPEPETTNWQEPQGLKVNHVYRLFASQKDIWVTSWKYGANRFSRAQGAPRAGSLPGAKGVVCSDGRLVWHVDQSGQRGGTYSQSVPDAEVWGCYTDEYGVQWLAASEGLFVRDGKAGYRLVLGGFGKGTGFLALWPSRRDGFWLSDGFTTCLWRTRMRVYEGCFQPHDYERVFDGVELPDGRLWVIKETDRPDLTSSGVSEVANGQWRDLAGSIPEQGLLHIRPSPRGGYWISGKGTLRRIAPCDGCPLGWRTLETPATAQGLAGNSAKDVIETEGGDLWVGGNNGVWRIPAQARAARPVVDSVRILQINIDGRAVSDGQLQMKPQNALMEIVFTALSFKQADLLTYRYRAGPDQRWVDLGHQTRLQWTRPRPGNYRLQVAASADGIKWTPPAEVQVKVLPPWFLSLPALVLYAGAFGGLLWGGYNLRVRHLLALERQRTLIAMDLHDELGASLSSIAMLAAAARYAGAESDTDSVTSQIVNLAHRSGLSLRSLGQTLAVQTADAGRFAWEVASQARSLMVAPTPRLHLDLATEAKGVYFSAQLRRQVLLVLMEALTNIKKHAQATEVIVRLRPAPDQGENLWKLCVEDNGKGMTKDGLGSGMAHMRRRAEAVGGHLSLESQSPGGTCIRLRFSPSRSTSGPFGPCSIAGLSKSGIRSLLPVARVLKRGLDIVQRRTIRQYTKEK